MLRFYTENIHSKFKLSSWFGGAAVVAPSKQSKLGERAEQGQEDLQMRLHAAAGVTDLAKWVKKPWGQRKAIAMFLVY